MRVFAIRHGLTLGFTAIAWTTAPQLADSQTRWEIEPKSSIAWWQVDPHLNHLWATTCTRDESWRPGHERTGGNNSYDYTLPLPKAGYSNTVDTVPMPAYPRLGQAEPVCPEAVSGGVTVADPARWEGVRGIIRVLGDSLQTGNDIRDALTRRGVFETQRYQYIEFTVDSVSPVQFDDTLRGTFHGTLKLLGAAYPYSGPAKGWMQSGHLRVQAQFQMLAKDLIKKFGVSKYVLGLGVSGGIWRRVFMGVDVLLRPVETPVEPTAPPS